jgi:hypothetical protein
LDGADYQNKNIKPDMNIPFTNNAPDILSSWIALEVLSPQTFRKPEDLAGAYGSIAKLENPGRRWRKVKTQLPSLLPGHS